MRPELPFDEQPRALGERPREGLGARPPDHHRVSLGPLLDLLVLVEERLVRGEDQEYSTYVLLHGVVQHNLYHAGQLMLLKKALRTS